MSEVRVATYANGPVSRPRTRTWRCTVSTYLQAMISLCVLDFAHVAPGIEVIVV